MSLEDFDLAPPPHEQITICRSPVVGWYVVFDRELVACFRTIGELTQWLDDTFGPLDEVRRSEPLPAVLAEIAEQPRRSMWSLIRGGKP